ncbi:MAG: ATP-binding cassette domain-containing protein [Treponema sp.]|jgi:ABC-type multidrug transport system ATPase subunit|nr:ATP-binding cassette domain-containing protein [Treponema sp.]
MAAIIEMKNVSFSTQNRLIINDFSHVFEEGKTTALVGPSGCGKSTVLKLSAGLLVPTDGAVFFRDMDIFNMNRPENLAFRQESAMVFQDSALWANQSLYQSLELPLKIHFPKMSVQERKKRIDEVLAEVGYKRTTDIRPATLSMGEQKLIAFARALVCNPSLLFLDEWTESLDEHAAQRLINLVQRFQKEKNTVILVSHDFRIVKNLADYVVMIMAGEYNITFTREQIEENKELAEYVENGIAS